MSPKRKLNIDLVVPVFNEAGIVAQTYKEVCKVIDTLPHKFTISYVDDGSSDGTVESLNALAKADKRIIVLELSRNFGHQAALTAGLDAAQGDFVISMDADGQHPAEMIGQMIGLFEQGYDIVQAQRVDEAGAYSFKKITSSLFYKFINAISGTEIIPGAADFRGMSRQAVDALKAMPEYHRFLRGMIAFMGYKSVILPYRETKRIGGRSKYSISKMCRLAMDAIFFLFACAFVYRYERGGCVLLSRRIGNALCIFLLGERRYVHAGAGVEFTHVCHPDRQWIHSDRVGFHRCVYRIHLPASEGTSYLSLEKEGGMSASEKPVYQFVFLRHGESLGNAQARWQGQSDYPLTDKGRAQSHALAERWKSEGAQFDLVISSSLGRARETAEIIASALSLNIEFDSIWLERAIGEMEGLTADEVRQKPRPPFVTPYDSIGGDGEGDWALFLRAGQALHGLLQRPAGSYLIVSHGGLLNQVMHAVTGIAPHVDPSGVRFRFENTAFARVIYYPHQHRWAIDAVNDHAHLQSLK